MFEDRVSLDYRVLSHDIVENGVVVNGARP